MSLQSWPLRRDPWLPQSAALPSRACPPCTRSQATIEFPPTFKVERQDGLHYKPQRSPAWCDRVLYRANVPCKKAQVGVHLGVM